MFGFIGMPIHASAWSRDTQRAEELHSFDHTHKGKEPYPPGFESPRFWIFMMVETQSANRVLTD